MNPGLVLQVVIVAAGALALTIAIRRAGRNLRTSAASAFEEALVPAAPSESTVDELRSFQQAVESARVSAFGLHYGLRPILRRIALARLRVRRGVDLDRDPAEAARLLGDEAYRIVTDPAPRSSRPRGPGMDLDTLDRIIRALESL